MRSDKITVLINYETNLSSNKTTKVFFSQAHQVCKLEKSLIGNIFITDQSMTNILIYNLFSTAYYFHAGCLHGTLKHVSQRFCFDFCPFQCRPIAFRCLTFHQKQADISHKFIMMQVHIFGTLNYKIKMQIVSTIKTMHQNLKDQ